MHRSILGALVVGVVACAKDDSGGDVGFVPTTGPTQSEGTPTGSTPITTYHSGCPLSFLAVQWAWSDDGAAPPDGCDDTLTIDICDPIGEEHWWLGIAETADLTGGWFGEDCLGGTLEVDVCHAIGPYDTIVEAPGCDASEVADGVTLFDASKDLGVGAWFLTYVIEDSIGYCFTWGHDPTYYEAVGCRRLTAM